MSAGPVPHRPGIFLPDAVAVPQLGAARIDPESSVARRVPAGVTCSNLDLDHVVSAEPDDHVSSLWRTT